MTFGKTALTPLECPQVNVCVDTQLTTIHMNETYTYIGLIGTIASFVNSKF
jgi:hypothetical protein